MAKIALVQNSSASAKKGADFLIVMVQDSFQTPFVYEKLCLTLSSRGYAVLHPQLPSCSDPDDPSFPTRTLIDDATRVQQEVRREVEQHGKIIMLTMHSYGGLVGSEAIPEELSYSYRKANGLAGGVIHLFYFCAFLLKEGRSVLGAFEESPNNYVRVCIHKYLFAR